MLYDKRKLLFNEDEIYMKRIGSIYEELKEDKPWYVVQFYPIFMARRFTFALLLIVIESENQIQLNAFIFGTALVSFASA